MRSAFPLVFVVKVVAIVMVPPNRTFHPHDLLAFAKLIRDSLGIT